MTSEDYSQDSSSEDQIVSFAGPRQVAEDAKVDANAIATAVERDEKSEERNNEEAKEKNEEESKTTSNKRKLKTRAKRTKERKIREMLNGVTMWRELYTGIMRSDGIVISFTLQESADIIEIPKKTLDDYLLQIKNGKKYNFPFDQHLDDNVGVLRKFIKENNNKTGATKTKSNKRDKIN